jgi:antitoxin ParD1/3/4
MNISLTTEQEQFLQEQLASGKYSSIDEVIAQAFRLLEEDERHYQSWVEETREKLAIGVEQADKGQLTDGKVAIDKLREKLLKFASQPRA